MRALVIAPQPFFSPRGTPLSVYYRTLVTSELNVEVDLLTYGQGQDVDIPGVHIIRIPRFKALGNVKTGPSGLKVFLDMFILLWTIALLLRNRYDFVHSHEEAVFLCRLLKPLFRFKLVYDMHSSLPQQLTNFNFTNSSMYIGAFKKLENTSIRVADAVITICPALADYVEKLIGKHEKHLLIENSIFEDVRLVATSDGNPTIKDMMPESQPVELPANERLIVYTGTLESYQGIDVLIGALQYVVNALPDVHLLIVGGSPHQVEYFSVLAQQHGSDGQCTFTGRVPQKLAKYYNSIAHVIVSPRSAGTNTPLKLYEQLASGKPLVATRIYSHTQVLDDNVAFLVEPTPDGMAKGIIEALTDKTEAATKVANAKALYQKKYSRDVYEAKMRSLLKLLK